jgi:hypothetical protein
LSQYVFLMEAVITKKIPCCIKYEVFLQEWLARNLLLASRWSLSLGILRHLRITVE